MIRLDEHERKIVKELIKNPRISDNQISKNTKVPVMTVNRKRKKLEEAGLIDYYTALNTGEDGTGTLPARELFIIKFKIGLTQREFLAKIENASKVRSFFAEHVEHSFLGEKDGHLSLAVMVNAQTESRLMEIFNGILIPFFKERFGSDAIQQVTTMHIGKPIRLHHNYLPWANMTSGRVKDGWSDDWVFVDIEEGEEQKSIMQFGKKQ